MSSGQLGISDHAVERFRERVRPALDLDDARRELLRLTQVAEIIAPPEWAQMSDDRADGAVLLSDDVCLLVSYLRENRPVAVTCVFRGWCGSRERAARNRERRRRKNRGAQDPRKLELQQGRARKKAGRPYPGEDRDWREAA